MQHDTRTLLEILRAARLIIAFTSDTDEEPFHTDVMRQSAVQHQIMIMGEAAKRLSADFRAAHPNIAWAKIAGMRDVLVHGYDVVNLEIVWQVARVNVPALIADLEQMIDTDTE